MCDNNRDSRLEEETGGFMLASDYPKKRAGRKRVKETRHPVYRGVRQRSSGKWVSEVRQPNTKERIWLGTFLTADMAARAHDVASIALRGREGACLNFADSVCRLPVPASSDTKGIQKAAADAAKAFRPAVVAVEPPPQTKEAAIEGVSVDYYNDEDMVFGMARLLEDMYQGLGMSPPPSSYHYDHDHDDDNEDVDGSLWSYSF